MNKTIRKLFIGFVFFLLAARATAGTVDTVTTYSASMKKNIKAVLIKPDNYDKGTAYPVVYLLHGYGGNQTDWISRVAALKQYVDEYNLLIICADGNISSWYFDSPVDSTWKYETYVSQELVQWVDSHLNTIKNKTGRAITGLSMGGHGALYLAFKHQDVFGAAGSMSGGVDIIPFPNNWDIAKRLGTYAEHPERWEENSVINLVGLLKPNSLAIIFDCGVDVFFYKVNVNLHDKLLAYKIPHDFITRPGGHSWEYWSNSIGYQLQFMSKYFNSNNKNN